MLSEGLRQEVKPYNIRTTIISPGAVESELPQSITEADVAKGIQVLRGLCHPCGQFARMVAFAIGQPDEVDVNEILFRPTAPGVLVQRRRVQGGGRTPRSGVGGWNMRDFEQRRRDAAARFRRLPGAGPGGVRASRPGRGRSRVPALRHRRCLSE